ncbi:amidase [Pseudoxanthomonas kaohsiungensis]|uniref:Amidase n=1 Tax=Pseudoxanthomonas kaohsiungensis TaxID=283923 RepID=A0ABW3LXJ0_9GAMM|nr:amidase [Pseudoxanthomonas kaohsiungensis]KAF1703876.1 amidase [Pseudoxanthomonas kaohsiungensis]
MRPTTWLVTAVLCCLASACRPDPEPAQDAARPTPSTTGFAYAEAGIADLQAAMARGETSSHALVQAYLARIIELDRNGPRLNAIISLNPRARADAAALDAERAAGRVRGPLHGIPVLLKDNIDATPMATTAGSLALAELRPAHDAFLVARLREAGAVVLGKANLSEWANFRSSRSLSGWSSIGGQTRNPYALDRSPCGSSSGTAVAVAANMTAVGIGTETDGSILCPAAVNGVVGLKPTVGLVSRNGIVPIAPSQDTAGPMARSVEDAAILLAAIAGRDPADPATADNSVLASFDYAQQLRGASLRGVRIGLLRDRLSISPEAATATERAVAAMRDAGAVVVDARIPTQDQWRDDEREVLLSEFKPALEQYLRQRQAPVQSLRALIDYNRAHASQVMPLFGQDLFEQADARTGLASPDYISARTRARRLAGPEGIDAALEAQQLDVLVAPTTGVAWPVDPAQGDHFPGSGYGAAAVAGYPALTVPMGHSDGLPLGLTFIGPAWSEARLLRIGHAYEQLTRARHPPGFAAGSPQSIAPGNAR